MTQGAFTVMTEKTFRQTTIRVDPELLRKARFYLDEHDKSINEFLVEQLEKYVESRDAQGGLRLWTPKHDEPS